MFDTKEINVGDMPIPRGNTMATVYVEIVKKVAALPEGKVLQLTMNNSNPSTVQANIRNAAARINLRVQVFISKDHKFLYIVRRPKEEEENKISPPTVLE